VEGKLRGVARANINSRDKRERLRPPTAAATSVDFFDRWLSISKDNVGKHVLLVCTENKGSCDEILDELRNIVRSHYVAPEVIAERIAELGAPKAAELLREHLPTTKTARSGDIGEVLATEFAERKLGFGVPVRRLRWKDGRDMALRGDDIIALVRGAKGRLRFLKGESKSRERLTSSVVTEAANALDQDRGRPSRHSVLFVADRLREQGKGDLARDLEIAVLHSFHKCPVNHLLFTVSGNDPKSPLSSHLSSCKNIRRRHAVGVRIADHGKFINRLFSEV
jgi:hypothetical protein